MTDEEVAVKLEGHDKEIGSLKHRMSDQETASKQINDIILSVKELALNMARMLEEQKILSGRVKSLEDRPGQTWDAIIRTAITAIVSALAGGIAVWVVQGLALHMH